MKHSIATSIAVVALLTFACPARANVPDLVPVQGVLTNAAGEVINGNVDVHFALYDSGNAATPLWSEHYDGGNQIYVDAGFFTVYLGTLTSLPLDVIPGADELWLGISVGEDAEMDRVRLASVPFAVEAQFCRQIGDLEADDIQPRVNIGGDTSAGACGAGQVIQAIDPVTGAISCVTDQTSGSTGGGIVSVSGVSPVAATDDGNGHVTVEVAVGVGADDVAAGDHTHSGEYIPMQTCTLNYVLKYTASGWTCAADIDTNTIFTAGTGLTLSGTQFNVTFGGTGSASAAARSDHNHDSAYVELSGDSMTGVLSVTTTGGSGYAQGAVRGTNNQSGGAGVYGYANNGYGVAGQSMVGVYGVGTSQGVWGSGPRGVQGITNCSSSSCYGVYGSDNGTASAFAGYFDGNVVVDGDLTYANEKTGYLAIHAAGFTPPSSSIEYVGAVNGIYRYLAAGASARELDAAVTLPHGVTVTGLHCNVVDNSATYNFTYIGLVNALTNSWRCGPFGSSNSSASNQWIGVSDCQLLIDNLSTLYYLRVGVDGNCGSACLLYGCRITYTYKTEGR